MKSKIIERICAVCGKKLNIISYENHSYEGGHYFGKIEIPVDWNSYKIIDDNYEIYPGWKVPIFEWTCECAEEEYWECDDCYYN